MSRVKRVEVEISHDAFLALPRSHQLMDDTVTVWANPPAPSPIAVPTPLMVVAAPTTTLLLAASVVATAAEALLAIVSIGAIAVLAGSGTAAHSIAASVDVVSLQIAGVAAVTSSSAHLRVLRRETASTTGRVVGGRSRARSTTTTTTKRWRWARGVRLGIAEGLQVISRARCGRLVLAVEGLALRLVRRGTASEAVMCSAETATSETRLATSLARTSAAIFAQSGAKAALAMKGRGSAKSAGRRRVVIGSIGGHSIRLAIHATLAAIRTEAALPVARVVLVIVRVAVVRVTVSGVLSMGLRLRTWRALLRLLGLLALLRLLALLALLPLLLCLGGRVGRRVTTILAVVRAAESRLVVQRAALRVLTETIGSIVAGVRALLGDTVVQAMGTLLGAVLLPICVVGGSLLLVGSVVVGVLAGRRGKGSAGLLTLRLASRGGVVVEWRLS